MEWQQAMQATFMLWRKLSLELLVRLPLGYLVPPGLMVLLFSSSVYPSETRCETLWSLFSIVLMLYEEFLLSQMESLQRSWWRLLFVSLFSFLKVHLRSSMVESSWESLLRRRENKCCCSPAEMRNIRSVWRSSPLKINLLHPWKSVIQNLCEKFN